MKIFDPIVAVLLVVLSSAFAAAADSATGSELPSFRRDVMPVLFRAGCNSGTCHGSARGKDGFQLSLFGYDPKGDYFRITQQMIGRRVNVASPEKSLLLSKAIGAVPHTGGKRFDKSTQYYKTLLRWVEAGANDDAKDVPEVVDLILSKDRYVFEKTGQKSRLIVTAISSDGSQRDVTNLARFHSNNASVATIDGDGNLIASGSGDTNVFARFSRFAIGAEIIVLPPAKGFRWTNPPAHNYIDELVFDRLQKLRIVPSELCSDESFLRRVTLDLAGRPPTVEEYKTFMADQRWNRRKHKIDELLKADAFADYWTSLWAERLRLIGGNYAPTGTHVKAADVFYRWIQKQIRDDRPLNDFVADMVTASGSNLINGPSNIYTMMVHAPRFSPKPFAADFSQVFLGIQIQCAECHNHPFDRWTMDDYYGFVSFFVGMKRKPGVESRERRIYYDKSAAPARHLVDRRPMPAKVLGGINPAEHNGDPRYELAKWLTSPDNKMFSRNLANRIWAQLIGRGIIEPVDDVRVTNPPSNGPLLDALSKRLVESDFQLRSLVRDICNSRVYQLSAEPNDSNQVDTRQFSHAKLRRLRADILMDSVVAVTGVGRRFSGFPEGTPAIAVYPRVAGSTEGPKYGDQFFETFGRSSRETICACETKTAPTLSQTLHLSVGDTINSRLASSAKLKEILAAKKSTSETIDQLFILALSRRATTDELESILKLFGDDANHQSVFEDIFWGLLNSTEFAFNH